MGMYDDDLLRGAPTPPPQPAAPARDPFRYLNRPASWDMFAPQAPAPGPAPAPPPFGAQPRLYPEATSSNYREPTETVPTRDAPQRPGAAPPPEDRAVARGIIWPYTKYESGKFDWWNPTNSGLLGFGRGSNFARRVFEGEIPLDRESIANNPALQNEIANMVSMGIGAAPFAKSANVTQAPLLGGGNPLKNFTATPAEMAARPRSGRSVGAPSEAELQATSSGQIAPLTRMTDPYHPNADLRGVARAAEVQMKLDRTPPSAATQAALDRLNDKTFKNTSTRDLTDLRMRLPPNDPTAQLLGRHLDEFMGARGTPPPATPPNSVGWGQTAQRPPPTQLYQAGQDFAGGFGNLGAAERSAAIAGRPAPPSLFNTVANAAGNTMSYGGLGSRLGAGVSAAGTMHMLGAPPWASIPAFALGAYFSPRLGSIAGAGAGAARTLGPNTAEAVLARQRSPLFIDQVQSGAREYINPRRDLALEMMKQLPVPMARDATSRAFGDFTPPADNKAPYDRYYNPADFL